MRNCVAGSREVLEETPPAPNSTGAKAISQLVDDP